MLLFITKSCQQNSSVETKKMMIFFLHEFCALKGWLNDETEKNHYFNVKESESYVQVTTNHTGAEQSKKFCFIWTKPAKYIVIQQFDLNHEIKKDVWSQNW